MRGGEKIISRIYSVSPKDIELFHLRLLLLHVKGPKSFEDVKSLNGIPYNSFVEACHVRRIASNDNEWRECLNESKEFQHPEQLRHMFGFICGLNYPPNAFQFRDDIKDYLCEDFINVNNVCVQSAYNGGFLEIEDILLTHNMTCDAVGLPTPVANLDGNIVGVDSQQEKELFKKFNLNANDDKI